MRGGVRKAPHTSREPRNVCKQITRQDERPTPATLNQQRWGSPGRQAMITATLGTHMRRHAYVGRVREGKRDMPTVRQKERRVCVSYGAVCMCARSHLHRLLDGRCEALLGM